MLRQARELHASGALRFVGEYAGGVRHGEGIELREDGGCLAGTWVEGELHGTRCAYLYPCARGGALVGSWERGTMRRASYQLLGAAAAEEKVGDEAGTETGAGGTEGGDAEGGGGGSGGAGAGGGGGGGGGAVPVSAGGAEGEGGELADMQLAVELLFLRYLVPALTQPEAYGEGRAQPLCLPWLYLRLPYLLWHYSLGSGPLRATLNPKPDPQSGHDPQSGLTYQCYIR